MKVAILISGEYRTFPVCRKTMKFLDNVDADIYFSTWDKTIYSNKKLNLFVEEYVTKEQIISVLGREAIIEIEPWDLIQNKKFNTKFLHRIQRGLELIQNNNKSYDYIVILRPDLFFNQYSNPDYLKYKYNMGFAWLPHKDEKSLNDPFFIASYNKMQEFYNKLIINDWSDIKNSNIDWHVWWYYFIQSISPTLVAATEVSGFTFCRMWATQESTYSDVCDIHNDWRNLTFLNQCEYNMNNKNWIPHPAFVGVYDIAIAKWNSGEYDKYKCNMPIK